MLTLKIWHGQTLNNIQRSWRLNSGKLLRCAWQMTFAYPMAQPTPLNLCMCNIKWIFRNSHIMTCCFWYWPLTFSKVVWEYWPQYIIFCLEQNAIIICIIIIDYSSSDSHLTISLHRVYFAQGGKCIVHGKFQEGENANLRGTPYRSS